MNACKRGVRDTRPSHPRGNPTGGRRMRPEHAHPRCARGAGMVP